MTVKKMRKLLVITGAVAFEGEDEPWAEYWPENIPEEYNNREIEFIETGSVVFRLKEKKND